MTVQSANRRPYGTGSLFVRTDRSGRQVWYVKWRQGGRQVKRALGPVRRAGMVAGLTRAEAEAELRRKLSEAAGSRVHERLDFREAGTRYLRHVEHFRGRKRSTVQDYRSILHRHLIPFFGPHSLEAIDRRSVESYQRLKLDEGLSAKTLANQVRFLHGIYRHAVGRGWASHNPVTGIEHAGEADRAPELRALSVDELAALLEAVPEDAWGMTDRVLYLAAAITGLRQGELQALRWEDLDWATGVVRVRRSYVRGEFTAPKSVRSIRAVPVADRLADALARHCESSTFSGREDLVFCNPHTGRPYDESKMRKRFKEALRSAGLREVRFHDLRHTFGTRMAGAGAPMRFLQEWMGHRDYKTTSIYAAYAADTSQGAAYARRAFSGIA